MTNEQRNNLIWTMSVAAFKIEHNGIEPTDQSEIDFIKGIYVPQMKAALAIAEDTIHSNCDNIGSVLANIILDRVKKNRISAVLKQLSLD